MGRERLGVEADERKDELDMDIARGVSSELDT